MTNPETIKKHQGDLIRLYAFMSAHGIDRFSVSSIADGRINGVVGWPDGGSEWYDPVEETQEISWKIGQGGERIDDALSILRVLVANELIDVDKIIVLPEQVQTYMIEAGASVKDFETALETLLEMRVDMVDDGELTDFFFFHF